MKISREDRNCLIASIERCLKQQRAATDGDPRAIVAFNASARSLNELLDCVCVPEISMPVLESAEKTAADQPTLC